MRKILIIACALIPCLMSAQDLNFMYTHPAGNGDKVLTMAEVTWDARRVYPSRSYARWIDDTHYAAFQDGKMMLVDAKTASVSEYKPTRSAAAGMVPEGVTETAASCKGAVSYSKDGALFIACDGKIVNVASPEAEGIVYGTSVSRNEFGISGGMFWSNDGGMLAFYRKDESRVTEFPLLDIKTRTGELNAVRYPMNGMTSEEITLGVYRLSDASVRYVKVDDFDSDRYLTNITWSPDDRYIFIQVLDRAQHNMRLNMYSSEDGSYIRTILSETSDTWVEPQTPLEFIKGRDQFIYRTDNRDGWWNLYLCDYYGTVRRLTEVNADVKYLANDGKSVYYTSAEVSPVENHLFRIDINWTRTGAISQAKFSKPVRLTTEQGWHSISINSSFTSYIDSYSSFNVPAVTDLCDMKGKIIRNISTADDPLAGYATGEVRFGTVPSADGLYKNYFRLFLPKDFDPSKKYPVVVYVYGGPHSQMVQDTWLGNVRIWEELMAQRGYIGYVQDNRGTGNQGAAYEKAINRQCGQVEMEDQMVGVNALKALPYVDAERIGVHGWSYGGFMTTTLITNHPETFKVAVAGGPVIDWKWYEIMYGERYMDTMETNPEGFAKTSLINKAKDLKGKLLICQGAIDATVVWEHSLSFIQECIENNVQVDYFPYPCTEHNVAGKWREHLMQKVTDYFDNNL
ncbi:MAG: DPP IV N-terminal domain-containing protein [Bacteroidales bacterium]|nr:DPP IV N-terminal domain-containing protein [Bacteroidales bacterium]